MQCLLFNYDCPAAIAMKHRQKEIREAEAELERYKSETDTLQAKLIEAEKILVSALHLVVKDDGVVWGVNKRLTCACCGVFMTTSHCFCLAPSSLL